MGLGRLADGAGRHLDVVAPQGRDDVGDGQVARRGAIGVDPDPHGIVAGGAAVGVADAGDAQDGVADVQADIVGDVLLVERAVGRIGVHGQEDVAGALPDRDAGLDDLRRQQRRRGRHPVFHQHLGGVRVGAERERDGDGHVAVAGRLRGHVDHVLHAVDLLLDRRGDGVGQHLGRGAGIVGRHVHRRRRDVRILRDGQGRKGHRPGQGDQDGDHRREHRPVDEKVRNSHRAGGEAAGAASTMVADPAGSPTASTVWASDAAGAGVIRPWCGVTFWPTRAR